MALKKQNTVRIKRKLKDFFDREIREKWDDHG